MRAQILPLAAAAVAAATLVPFLNAQTVKTSGQHSYSYQTSARKYSYALVQPNGSMTCWGTWNSEELEPLRSQLKEDALFVKKDGDMYLIADRTVINKAKAAMEPVQKLGQQQGELGKEQGMLGRQQGDLGRRQGDCGREMAEAARSGEEGMEKRMREISKKMEALGKQQSALGEKQKALGQRQKELGKRQAAAGQEADRIITLLIDDAFSKGLAKRL